MDDEVQKNAAGSGDAVTAQSGGALYAAAAYVSWGFIPLYFKPLSGIPATVIIAHRIIWCLLLLIGIRALSGGVRALRPALTPKVAGWLVVSSLCIGANWLLYVYAIAQDQVLQTSLGYYITPLLSTLLGVVVLREAMRALQWAAVGLAACAVILAIARFGEVPWIALGLAFVFSHYGFIRKRVAVDATNGLLIEMALLAPAALLYLGCLWRRGEPLFAGAGWGLSLWLLLSGAVTVVPMLCFAMGARRLPLGTLGFLQYIEPSLSFLVAVFIFGEPFGRDQAAIFGFIWPALALFSVDLLRHSRARRNPVAIHSP